MKVLIGLDVGGEIDSDISVESLLSAYYDGHPEPRLVAISEITKLTHTTPPGVAEAARAVLLTEYERRRAEAAKRHAEDLEEGDRRAYERLKKKYEGKTP